MQLWMRSQIDWQAARTRPLIIARRWLHFAKNDCPASAAADQPQVGIHIAPCRSALQRCESRFSAVVYPDA
jgi:hypothetical protein